MQAYMRNSLLLALISSIAVLKFHPVPEQNPNAEWKFQVTQCFKRLAFQINWNVFGIKNVK